MREGELWGKARDKGKQESPRWIPAGRGRPGWVTAPAWFRAGRTRDVWLSAVTPVVSKGLERRAVRSSSLKNNVLPRLDSIPHTLASKPTVFCFLFLRKEAAVNTLNFTSSPLTFPKLLLRVSSNPRSSLLVPLLTGNPPDLLVVCLQALQTWICL